MADRAHGPAGIGDPSAEVLDRITDAFFAFDADWHYTYVNRAGERLLGRRADELLGHRIWDAFPRTVGTVLERELRRAMTEQRPIEIEAFGEQLGRQQRLRAYPSAGGLTLYVEDVTERRALEAQLRDAQRLEAIGRLAGGVAHDFNNLLTIILSYASMLRASAPKGSELEEGLAELQAAGGRAAELTRQLLAFSRQQVLEPRVVDLNEQLRSMTKLLRALLREDIDLETFLAPELGRVLADPGQLEQVVVNLVANARDAMPTGGVLTIETANVALDEEHARAHAGVVPGPYVMLSVSDSGEGMDRDTLARIFEPFFTTKEIGRGTGLGLATVFGIVKQSGGHLWVYSERARGTTFKVYLPRVDAAEREPAPAANGPATARGNETILLVEDEPQVRAVLRAMLARAGYRLLEASSPDEAIRAAAAHEGAIHLLLTDVIMPVMNGRLLAERLRAARPEVRVLYMSGYTHDVVVHGVLDRGVAFLQKPITLDLLARKVREVLDAPEAPSI